MNNTTRTDFSHYFRSLAEVVLNTLHLTYKQASKSITTHGWWAEVGLAHFCLSACFSKPPDVLAFKRPCRRGLRPCVWVCCAASGQQVYSGHNADWRAAQAQ